MNNNEIINNLSNYKDESKDTLFDDTFKEVFLDSAYDKSSFIGKFMHLWKWRFYLKNYKNKKITIKDIPKLPTNDESEKLYNQLEKEWEKEVKNAAKNKRKPTLFYAILKIYTGFLIFLSIFGCLAQFSVLYQAMCMRFLIAETNLLNDQKIRFEQENDEIASKEIETKLTSTKYQVYFTCFLMVVLQLAYTNAINVYNYHTVLIGYRLKIAISSMIYRKTMRLSKSAFANTNVGQIQNLLSGDMNRLESIFYLIAYPFIGIVLSVTTILVLFPYLGLFTLVGMLVICLIIPIQSYLGKAFSYIRFKAALLTDERMKQMNEFIPAIRVIKMYCWENQFAQAISKARQNEIHKIRNCLYLFSVNMSLFYSGAKVVIYVTLVCYILFSDVGKINSELVYVTFATFNKLSFICLLYFPHFFLSIINGMIAIKRIDKFLRLNEIERTDQDVKEELLNKKASIIVSNLSSTYASKNNDDDDDDDNQNKNSKSEKSKNGKLNYKDNYAFSLEEKKANGAYESSNTLQNINFEVKPGELLVIIGQSRKKILLRNKSILIKIVNVIVDI